MLKKLHIFILFSLALSFAVLIGRPNRATAIVAPDPAATSTFKAEIPIPGLFSEQPADGSLLSNYLRAVYIYFIWTVGVLAVIMVMWGAIKWVAAAGNAGQIKDARETITNAVIGIIIALSSVVILNTINPNLTKLSLPDLGHVAPIKLGAWSEAGQCFPDITCGDDSVQVAGIQCPDDVFRFGVWSYSDPGAPACGNNPNSVVQSVCCQLKSNKNDCFGINSRTKKKTDMQACQAVPADYYKVNFSGCTDSTACGLVKTISQTSKCVGHTCAGNTLCVVSAYGQAGTCMAQPQNASGYKIARSCINADTGEVKTKVDLQYSSDIPCGEFRVIPGNITVYGVSNTCGAGKYCILNVQPQINSSDQCVAPGLTQCVPDSFPPGTQ